MAFPLARRVTETMRDNQQTRVGRGLDEVKGKFEDPSHEHLEDENEVLFTVSRGPETMLGTLQALNNVD